MMEAVRAELKMSEVFRGNLGKFPRFFRLRENFRGFFFRPLEKNKNIFLLGRRPDQFIGSGKKKKEGEEGKRKKERGRKKKEREKEKERRGKRKREREKGKERTKTRALH